MLHECKVLGCQGGNYQYTVSIAPYPKENNPLREKGPAFDVPPQKAIAAWIYDRPLQTINRYDALFQLVRIPLGPLSFEA